MAVNGGMKGSFGVVAGTAALIAAVVIGVWLGSRRSAEEPAPQPIPATAQPEPDKPVAANLPPAPPMPPPVPPLPPIPPSEPASIPERPTRASLSPVAGVDTLERLEGQARQLADAALPDRIRDLRTLGIELATAVDVKDLLDWLRILPDVGGRRALLRGYFEGLTNVDPRAAADLAANLDPAFDQEGGFSKVQAVSIVLAQWANASPAEAAVWAEQLPAEGNLRGAAWQAIAQKWAVTDPDAALAWSSDLGAEGLNVVRRVAQILGQRNAENAVQRVFEMEAGAVKDAYLAGVAVAWMGLDPKTAMDAIATIGDTSQRVSATHQAVVNWAHRDPPAAAHWVANIDDNNLRVSLQQNVARAWTARDPVAALAWAADQSDPRLREQLVAAAAPQAVWRDPKLAVDTVAALPDGQNRNNAVSRLVSNWAQRDPAAAATFAAESDLAASQRQTVMADAAFQWARRAPDDAAAWIHNLPNSVNRNNAVLGAASGAAKFSDGRLTAQWWTAMRDPNLDADTARTWLQRPEVPESVRDQLLPLLQ